MLSDPTKPTSPSTTISLRWLRRSGRCQRPLSGCTGQHQVPQHAHLGQRPQRPAVAGVGPRAHVVEQEPDRHAALDRPAQRVEERLGRRVADGDVELDVHVALGAVDGLDEGLQLLGEAHHHAGVVVLAAAASSRPPRRARRPTGTRRARPRPARTGPTPRAASSISRSMFCCFSRRFGGSLGLPISTNSTMPSSGQEGDQQHPRQRRARLAVAGGDDQGDDDERDLEPDEQAGPAESVEKVEHTAANYRGGSGSGSARPS